MHEYSCDSGRRDAVYVVSFLICAILAFFIMYEINHNFSGTNILLDILLSVLSLSPFALWSLFMHYCSSILLWLSQIHNCSGTYEGELTTSHDEFITKYPITMKITHRFQKMEIILTTDNSKSVSKTASLHQDGERIEIVYTYNNTGAVDENLNMHIGTCILTIENGSVDGQYYTHPDRKNHGKIVAHIVKND